MLSLISKIKYLVLCLAVMYCMGTNAQQTNFIHIQSESNQPFGVQLNGFTYSSSASGYLVIPQVAAGEHNLIVGFPQNLYPEYSFQCTISDKPRGFSLKLGVDNSWSLFDMVNFTVLKGKLVTNEQVMQPLPQSPPPEPEISKSSETAATKPIEVPVVSKKESLPVNTAFSSIQKIFDKTSSGGIDQVYVVINRGKADTVALFIPILKTDLPEPMAEILNKDSEKKEKDTVHTYARHTHSNVFRNHLLTK